MSEPPELATERELLSQVREDLATQFIRVARAEQPRRKRWLLFGVLAGFALVPASFAAAELLETEHSIVVDLHPDGNIVKVDGEIVDCPANSGLIAELGFDPCAVMKPAPAPLDARSPDGGAIRADPQSTELRQELDESLGDLQPSGD